MNLETTYLGLTLPHPILPGAGPLTGDLRKVRQLEDVGAPCLIMNSLFEEQIVKEQRAAFAAIDEAEDSFAEALSFLPEPEDYCLGPDEYLSRIAHIKAAVDIPVIASVNGISPDGWREYPQLIAAAGADALEVNLYHLSADKFESSAEVEERLLESVRAAREGIEIPIAVKLPPFFTSIPHFVSRLEELGVQAVVLFNRFYQPDIDIEELRTEPTLRLSTSAELNLRLRWLAILHGRTGLDLSLSGGIHESHDVIKGLMAGATTVQTVSGLLLHGPAHLRNLVDGVIEWMHEHEYSHLDQLRGCMSHQNAPDPEAIERGNYAMVLHSWTAD
ncbi:dihydroorotate dehydrogenase (fumarate) [Haloferula luteola]|uniref:Dihydroorotate dehydrogenase (Fumarate) n=1 Tax=Haloferula luteola TaxID=595692 RepID=A0A840VBC8_9BACT|nr:dihydroorotate dehydrogenase-like protein [Haloferula luteola]MBB5352854.1 dihydroorotate dehydrogenase (fumarate) [Haloferula luteola]